MPNADNELLPIGEVARRLGLRPSAVRYYEDRGLIQPTQRRGGRRWFDATAVRRLAVIQLWKRCGLLSLESIASFLTDGADNWAPSVDAHIAALTTQIRQLEQARDFLVHVRHHHQTTTPDGCTHYEALLDTVFD